MIKNSSDNMQHDNELFNDDVQLELLASSLAPFDNDINTVLVTMNPSFEATNHDFRDNQAFTIDLYSFDAFVFQTKYNLISSIDSRRNLFGLYQQSCRWLRFICILLDHFRQDP